MHSFLKNCGKNNRPFLSHHRDRINFSAQETWPKALLFVTGNWPEERHQVTARNGAVEV